MISEEIGPREKISFVICKEFNMGDICKPYEIYSYRQLNGIMRLIEWSRKPTGESGMDMGREEELKMKAMEDFNRM
jgi:hypothetical protein